MARSKQTARKGAKGKAPRKQLATKAARSFKAFMSSQQCSGRASYSTHTPQARMAREGKVVKTSFINHENTMGEFKFPVGKREEVKELSTRVVRTKAVDPVTGNIEDWIGVNFQSCYDDIGMQKCGRPPIELVLVLDISGSMSWGFDNSSWGNDPAKSKLTVAKRCIKAILAQLSASDSVGVVLFNQDSHTLIPLTSCAELDRADVAAKVDGIVTSGGTRLAQGFNSGVEMIAANTRVNKRRTAAAKGQATKAANAAAKASTAAAAASAKTTTSKKKSPKPAAKSKKALRTTVTKDANTAARLIDAAAAADAGPEITNRRVMFLTDMESSQQDEDQVLGIAQAHANGSSACHTTVVGIGVDVSVGTVQTLSKIPGCRYFSVSSAQEFEETVASEFAYDVTPIAFNLECSLMDGRTFAKGFGTSELNDLTPGTPSFRLSSEFPVLSSPSREASGAMYLFKLEPAATKSASATGGGFGASLWNAASAATAAVFGGGGAGGKGGAAAVGGGAAALSAKTTPGNGNGNGKGKAKAVTALPIEPPLVFKTTWTSRAGVKLTNEQSIPAPLNAAAVATDELGVRKGIALVRYVDLQAEYVLEDDDEEELFGTGSSGNPAALAQLQAKHAGWVRRFQEFKTWFLAEMVACNDTSVASGNNINIMDTINQIIELEIKEAATIEKKVSAAALVTVAAAGTGAGAPTADTPNEFLCPITSTLMVDPVIAVDGQSYERAAITQWFSNHPRLAQVLSPMTNKPLASRALVPNLSLRKLIQDHVAKAAAADSDDDAGGGGGGRTAGSGSSMYVYPGSNPGVHGGGGGAAAAVGGLLRKTRSSSNLQTPAQRSSPRLQPPAKRAKSRATNGPKRK